MVVRMEGGLLAAFLFGIATFSKPPNALLVVPLVLTLAARRQWRVGLSVCVAFIIAGAGAFVVNGMVAGEMNYQGGDRRTFYGRFPYGDPAITFDQLGQAMVTEDTDAESLFAPHVMFPLPSTTSSTSSSAGMPDWFRPFFPEW